jgi:hypothetical protein
VQRAAAPIRGLTGVRGVVPGGAGTQRQ